MINKRYGYGSRADIPSGAEESRIIPFVLSTYTRDRHSTVLNQEGWQLDNYRKNPVVAYQHTLSGGMCTDPDPDYVIGKSIRIDLEGMGRDRRLIGEVQFEPAEVNPLAEKIFRKVLFGSLSRSSVGFMEIGEGKWGEGSESRGGENETYYFAGQELVEWSIVNIPSNPDSGKRELTLRRMREEGYVALMYAFRELGGRFRLSEIENMTVRNILDLLDGKDLDIREKDPEKVREILQNPEIKAELARRQGRMRQLKFKAIKG
jgi:hypothetical protein